MSDVYEYMPVYPSDPNFTDQEKQAIDRMEKATVNKFNQIIDYTQKHFEPETTTITETILNAYYHAKFGQLDDPATKNAKRDLMHNDVQKYLDEIFIFNTAPLPEIFDKMSKIADKHYLNKDQTMLQYRTIDEVSEYIKNHEFY